MERDPRRGDLRLPALAGLRRGRGQGEGGKLQRGLHLLRPRHPFHHEGRNALRPGARLAGGQPAHHPLAGQPAGEKINQIKSIQLLGYKGKLTWKQTPEGLTVSLPAQKVSAFTTGLKITGSNLKPIPIPEVVEVEKQDATGQPDPLCRRRRLARRPDQDRRRRVTQPDIGYWDRATEWASWQAKVTAPGTFRVRINLATVSEGSHFVVAIGDKQLPCVAPSTGSWDTF